MDNNTNLSQSILQSTSSSSSIPSESSVFTPLTSNSEGQGGWFESLSNISVTTWILIILILAFLGFNIFVYLAKGTDYINKLLAPLLNAVFGITLAAGGQTVDVSAEGAKAVVGETAKIAEDTLTAVQNITPNSLPSKNSASGYDKPKEDVIQQDPLNQSMNKLNQGNELDYSADHADSSIQGGGKAGWCYIGQDRGFRSCAQVGVNDTCMSGDIFPTQEKCINPSLRQ